MSEPYPSIPGGGSLMLAYQVRNKKVLVIGGGEVASGRINNLLGASAAITCVAPDSGLHPEIAYRAARNQITHVDKFFSPEDLDDKDIALVLVAIDGDPGTSSKIYKLCKERRIPANIADVPSECDFYFGSVHRDGPLQVCVSTNGCGPKMAAIVRERIAKELPGNLGEAILKVGELRKRLRANVPERKEGGKRMRWMSKVCLEWSLEDLCEMDEEDMAELLKSYTPNRVPTLEEVRLKQDPGTFDFDGSWGWACVI